MNKIIGKFFAVMMSAVLVLSVCSVSAYADEKILVNGKEVKAGDTVTFEYYVGGIDDAVAAAGAFITYDSKCLKYVDDSIGFDVFNNAMFSVNDGIIYYAAVNSLSGYDLKEKRLAVSLSFEVLSTAKGSTTVKHEFDEFFTIKDESTDIDSDKYDDETKVTVNSYNGINSSPYLGIDANSSTQNDNSKTVSEILNGNPNSNASTSSLNSGSTSAGSTSSSANNSSDTSTSSIQTNSSGSDTSSSDNNNSDGGTISSVSGEESSNQDGSTFSTINSQISSLNSESEEDGSDGTAIVVIICVLFVVLCAGAVLYFTNSKKNRER